MDHTGAQLDGDGGRHSVVGPDDSVSSRTSEPEGLLGGVAGGLGGPMSVELFEMRVAVIGR